MVSKNKKINKFMDKIKYLHNKHNNNNNLCHHEKDDQHLLALVSIYFG